jgi:dethiobiotin synthetase
MSAFFVTATGTGIGKTFVAAGLIRYLRAQGKVARAFKPIVSGFERATAAGSDPGILLEAMGEAIADESLDRISPWRFTAPLSPDMAASREGKALDFDAIVTACRAQSGDPLFIEGVGGVMVPLDARHTVLDLMSALKIPLIAVTGTYLGTISHTLTAMEAIARAGLETAVLVVNETAGSSVPLADTVATLERFLPGIAVLALPRQATPVMGELAAVLFHAA